AWHSTVVPEACGQFLENRWTMNFLGDGDGESNCIKVGIKKVALRFRRRGRIVDDPNCHTDRLRFGRHADQPYIYERPPKWSKRSGSGTADSSSKCGLCITFRFSEVDYLSRRINVGRDIPRGQDERWRDVDPLTFIAQKAVYRDFDREFGNLKSPPDG